MTSAEFGAAEFQAETAAGLSEMRDVRHYLDMIEAWGREMNLVGPSALREFWQRHAWDSAQLLRVAPTVDVWADVGAGAGFPGVILAIFLKQRPGATVHLIESMTKRCRFLNHVVDELRLPVVVHNRRAEHTCIEDVQMVTARACAPMVRLLEFTEPLMRRGAQALFLKGKDVALEIKDARKSWRFDAEVLPSLSGVEGHIVKVEKIARA